MVLSTISKLFEKLLQKQIVGYVQRYRKNFNIQQAFLALIENLKKMSLIIRVLEELC